LKRSTDSIERRSAQDCIHRRIRESTSKAICFAGGFAVYPAENSVRHPSVQSSTCMFDTRISKFAMVRKNFQSCEVSVSVSTLLCNFCVLPSGSHPVGIMRSYQLIETVIVAGEQSLNLFSCNIQVVISDCIMGSEGSNTQSLAA
jgi:hypothetical protein